MKINLMDMCQRDLHHILTGAIVPRPIAWVSTIGADGILNLAPFSSYCVVSLQPAMVGFCVVPTRDGHKKDTLRNIESAKDFVINVVDESLAQAMNQTSAEYPSDVDEFKEVGLTPTKSDIVKSPMVAESPVNMECKLVQIMEFGEVPTGSNVVIGEVVLVHVKDDLWVDDHIDPSRLRAVGRMGGDSYCRTTDIFEMKRPYI